MDKKLQNALAQIADMRDWLSKTDTRLADDLGAGSYNHTTLMASSTRYVENRIENLALYVGITVEELEELAR